MAMKLSEKIRGCSEGPGDFEDWAEEAAQLEEENEVLKLTVRFWQRASVDNPKKCWEWTGSLGSTGYGQIKVDGKTIKAHRLAYQIQYGLIPDTRCVCHSCDNPKCVNPFHLFLGTHDDNIKDAVSKGRIRKGEDHGMAKLTDDSVFEIRRLYSRGASRSVLASMWQVSTRTIGDIVSRRTWKHL